MLRTTPSKVNPQLISNEEKKLYDELLISLEECQSFIFNVAFISFGGLQLFINSFNELKEKGVSGKILTSTYLNFTSPKALSKILEYDNIELRIHDDQSRGLHSKSYIFEYPNEYKIIVGSSNLTQAALKSNIEWNVVIVKKQNDPFVLDVKDEYYYQWNNLVPANEAIIENYRPLFEERIKRNEIQLRQEKQHIQANTMQKEALTNLEKLRQKEQNKALVIAATATGKTYMAAMDVKQTKPSRVLFIAHRENILDSAIESFRDILEDQYSTYKMIGTQEDNGHDIIFSTNQTMVNSLSNFNHDAFDYLIIDEAHHVTASTYQQILEHFKPSFTLGMTATPERGDQRSIFETFDHNIALEVRLDRAIDEQLIVPFHYFGITDIESVDLSDVDLDELPEVAKKLMIHSRTHYIISKMNDFQQDGTNRKGLGFCVNLEHARYMTQEFNEAGIPSVMLSGQDKPYYRQRIFDRLEDDEDELEMIFSVDVLSEGVDIPAVNLVLMLRPTNSPIVFLQQLGRGLRKHQDKEFLTVLDFIANHKRSFLLALALSGNNYRDKDHLKVQVQKQFSMGPKRIFIQMDRIIQEQIINQLNVTNFNHLKYLKEDYSQFKTLWLQQKVEENPRTYPLYLMDYYGIDRAPDPLSFAQYQRKNYLNFLSKTENDPKITELLNDKLFVKTLETLTKQLPLVRPIDFLILKDILSSKEITISNLYEKIKKQLDEVPYSWFEHSLQYLDQQFEDSTGLVQKQRMVEFNNNIISLNKEIDNLLLDPLKQSILMDVIDYGIIKYFEEFSTTYYGDPFLKVLGQYSMQDVGLVTNITNKISSFRGAGVIPWKNHRFLFVDLHKDADIAESINYKDKIISPTHMQWESQNNSSSDNGDGYKIVNHQKLGIKLHMFIRKQKEEDGKSVKYFYCGEVDVLSHEGNRPITMQMRFKNPLPYDLFEELITKV